jgi:cell wall-associated NlpC family hydrolase
VFRQLGIQLGRSSRDQIHDGTNVKKSELRKGDLVFFTGSRNRRTIGHVGIVTEVMDDGDFRFIHAARKGIVIDGFKSSAYYTKRYVGARRIVEE